MTASKRSAKRKAPRARRKTHAGAEDIAEISELPVLPSKDIVAFPSVMMSIFVARPSSVHAIEEALAGERLIFMVAQKNSETEDPRGGDLYQMGVIAHVVRMLQGTDGRYKVLLQGLTRARIRRWVMGKRFLRASVIPIESDEPMKLAAKEQAIINRIKQNLQILVENEHVPEEMLIVTEEVTSPGALADIVLAHYKLDVAYAQNVLEELNALKRLRTTDSLITDDLKQFILTEKIRDKARDEMSKGQREYFLREQIRQIQRELGEAEDGTEELSGLAKKLDELKLPAEPKEEATKQLKRLERMHSESSEYALLRTYLDWIAELPWNVKTGSQPDLKIAQRVLDEDHFGLEKVKDRVLEFLSVRRLNKKSKGPILCFIGPPGVGKTSLGRSIAKALGRRFMHMSLGGIRDEAEIRGHRRTYVGALPGRIIQGLKTAGSCDPVFVLDELDKVGADFRGDPASALLEVLDPQQNAEFRDLYLNVPFDLSDVLFLATANTTDTIPEALLDRLELIFIPGYTTQEKLAIAKKYLIPRQITASGIERANVKIQEDAILHIIEHYTREAGVRNLEREIGALCRKLAREIAEKRLLKKTITPERIAALLGPSKVDPEITEAKEDAGLVRGLAWTIHGGEVMPVEASTAQGSGQLALTGQLGNIMQESAQAALFYARANSEILGLDPGFHQKFDIHIHVPGGATPKDGPSAGITIATALVSALSGRKVKKDIAMTGEMTLRGNILAVGGLREKALAALRHGITKIIIPYENVKDLEEIPEEQRKQLQFIPVRHVSEVLEIALLGRKKEKKGAATERKRGQPVVRR